MRIFMIMSKNARSFKMTVGISLHQFDFLICDVEKAYHQAGFVRLDRPAAGAGLAPAAGSPCTILDRVLPVFRYYRGPTWPRAGWPILLRISWGSIPAYINKMSTIIRDHLPLPQKIRRQACKVTTMDDPSEIFPGLLALTDRRRTARTAAAAARRGKGAPPGQGQDAHHQGPVYCHLRRAGRPRDGPLSGPRPRLQDMQGDTFHIPDRSPRPGRGCRGWARPRPPRALPRHRVPGDGQGGLGDRREDLPPSCACPARILPPTGGNAAGPH